MHFEVPKVRMHSLRDFAQHYFMIVLSILTALGLEQWIEHIHHRHAAEQASAQIETELHGTLDSINNALADNAHKLEPLRSLREAISDDVRHGVPDPQINQHIREMKDHFVVSVSWPSFATQAWDVAVANQSAAWIDIDRLHKYATAYAAQRDASNWVTHDSTITLNGPRMVDLRTRISLGKDVDPVEFLGIVQQMINTSAETSGHLEQTAKPIEAALAKPAS
ncbi:hypothetical protein [Dyella amyloliquefaciens]|uniref:hypothetical protein n=1 Tax=Dyella amyloliquefaciens TaxID=1770545 RepID=UPI00102E500C|nr:hypothetical protein [Dyella amyloliquefaciens]